MAYPESNEQFNRQQGEELIAALTGEEAPDLGYPAINEQFNREQGDRLIEAVKNFSPSGGLPDPEAADIGKVLGIIEDGAGAKYAPVEGSGLPNPSALPHGTAMVAVNGQWNKQSDYGFSVDADSIAGYMAPQSISAELSPKVVTYHYLTHSCHLNIQEEFTHRTLYDADFTWPRTDSAGISRIVTVTDVDSRAWTFTLLATDMIPSPITVSASSAVSYGASIVFTNVSEFADSIYYAFNKNYIPDAVPDFTSSDNGKVLGVVDGKLAWVEQQVNEGT